MIIVKLHGDDDYVARVVEASLSDMAGRMAKEFIREWDLSGSGSYHEFIMRKGIQRWFEIVRSN